MCRHSIEKKYLNSERVSEDSRRTDLRKEMGQLESDKAETSLTDSTLLVKFEECLSVSMCHHSEG